MLTKLSEEPYEEDVSPTVNTVEFETESDEQIMTFKHSNFHIQPELTKYLKSLLDDPYNKYCIDCKINASTHAIVFHGTFVCYECMIKIKNAYGMESTYPKKVIGEHWDDY